MSLNAITRNVFPRLDFVGEWLSMLGLRLYLAYEFWESGMAKLHGENWFPDIQDKFPFPFNAIPSEISWQLATWSELLMPVMLVLGLGARFASLSLIILTIVAWISVHAGNGYNVCDNGFQLPLIYLVMFVPLLLSGPGKLSLDYWIARRMQTI